MAQQLWSWESAQFERLDKERVKAELAGDAWNVAIEQDSLAWGYRISLPEDARCFIMWRSTLDVVWANGQIAPGLAYLLGDEGIAIQVDVPTRKVELRHVMPTNITRRVATFKAPDDLEVPFKMQIEFNTITKVFTAAIAGTRVVHSKLPFRDLPSFDEISDVEILTTTDARPGGGTVSYGALTLECE